MEGYMIFNHGKVLINDQRFQINYNLPSHVLVNGHFESWVLFVLFTLWKCVSLLDAWYCKKNEQWQIISENLYQVSVHIYHTLYWPVQLVCCVSNSCLTDFKLVQLMTYNKYELVKQKRNITLVCIRTKALWNFQMQCCTLFGPLPLTTNLWRIYICR